MENVVNFIVSKSQNITLYQHFIVEHNDLRGSYN